METGAAVFVTLGEVLELREGSGIVLGGVGGEVGDDDVKTFSFVLGHYLLVTRNDGVHGGSFLGLVPDLARVILLDPMEVGTAKDVADIVHFGVVHGALPEGGEGDIEFGGTAARGTV